VATNATIFIFIKSDGVVVIFSAGQHAATPEGDLWFPLFCPELGHLP